MTTTESVKPLKLIESIGRGVYGEVFLARNHKNEEIAIKKHNISTLYCGTCLNFRELDQLLYCQGFPYIVSVKSYYFDDPFGGMLINNQNDNQNNNQRPGNAKQHDLTPDPLVIGLEKGDTNLCKWIKENNGKIKMDDIKTFMVQTLLSLEYLNSRGICHRDIKPDNIIVFNQPNGSKIFKLTDFGFSNFYNSLEKTDTSIITPWYRAPRDMSSEKT